MHVLICSDNLYIFDRSVGSLGKYKNEQPVVGVNVTNCRLSNTTNGARIKTWANEYGGEASGIIFDNLILDHVKAPIVIDQSYGSKRDPVIDSAIQF